MYLEICLIIFSAAIFILVIFCIPILIQLWRATKDIALSLETLNQSLPTILKNLEEITLNISNSTTAVNREVQNFSGMVGRFQSGINEVADKIQYITPIVLKSPTFRSIKSIIAVAKGIRVFLNVFLAKTKTKV